MLKYFYCFWFNFIGNRCCKYKGCEIRNSLPWASLFLSQKMFQVKKAERNSTERRKGKFILPDCVL